MIKEDFAIGISFLHNRDAAIKIIVALCFAMQIAVISSIKVACASLVVSFILLGMARLSPIIVAKRLLFINLFTFFLWLTLPFTYQGSDTLRVAGFDISIQGIYLAALISIKTNASIIAFISLLSTSSPAAIGRGLENLKVPRKLCYILLFSYRYIFVIHKEYLTLYRAAKMRCFQTGTNMHTYRTFAYLFGMTLVRSHNRAERIQQAMVLRGFDGYLRSLNTTKRTKIDFLFLGVFLCVITILIFLQLYVK